MDEVITLIRSLRIWLYAFFGVLLVVSLRLILQKVLEYRNAFFRLEREIAVKRLTGMSIFFSVSLLLLVVTFLTTTFTNPVIKLEPTPTPAPTLAFLAVPTDKASLTTGIDTAVPVEDDILLVGCDPTVATIQYPEDGDELSGVENIIGTANIQNFAFYKYEYRSIAGGSIWRSIFASTEPVVEEKLGTWDTGLVSEGDYLFRLVVADTAGNAPYPCVIQVHITAEND
ncbi:MAG: hypothetical protein JXA25_01420 [Anaerolineales bacterium]|nr:hypothetical protein [Anaerolineales bacterium]